MKLKPIDEQVVVIVGATSGIGRETALKFAEKGAKIVVAGRSQESLDRLSEELHRLGSEAMPYSLDVANFEQVRSLADAAVSRFGRIDTWVHLAAVSIYAKFSDTSPEEFRRVMEVNLLGQIHGALAALPYLKQAGGGALIHVSSVEGKQSMPLTSAYAASKHGIVGFVDALRMELEHEGANISITTVIPASINTPLFNKAETKIGVFPRPLPPVYEPEVAAEAILYAAEHPIREIYAGGAGKTLGMLRRISPRLAEKMFVDSGFALQKSDIEKSSNAPSNLYQHIDGYDRVYGDFGDEAKERSAYTKVKTRPVLGWIPVAALAAGAVGLSIFAFRTSKGRITSLPDRIGKQVDLGKMKAQAKKTIKKTGIPKQMKRLRRREDLLDRISGGIRRKSLRDRITSFIA